MLTQDGTRASKARVLRAVLVFAVTSCCLGPATAHASTSPQTLGGAQASVIARALVGGQALRRALRDDLETYLRTRSKAEHISALSLSVDLPSGAAIDVVAGTTAIGSATAVQPSNLFNIGSNTKAFTACVLLQLEAEGKLTMDQTVGRWLPQYPAWSSVTIKRLLNMTSGIPTYDNDPRMERAQAVTIRRRWTDPVLVAFADPMYGNAPGPTRGWSYSNTNYLLAGMIIERASGHTYKEEIERRLIRPLGLSETFYSPNVYPATVTDRLVSGYFFNSDPINAALKPLLGRDMRLMDMSWAGPAGGIIGTPRDVARWARAMYSGTVLAPPQQRELETLVSMRTGKPMAHPSAGEPTGFGLGVVQAVRPPIGTYWYYQGETLGYRMIHVWLPNSDAAFALGLNSQPPGAQEHQVGSLLVKIYQDLVRSGAIRSNT